MLAWLYRLFRRNDPYPVLHQPWELTPMDFSVDWYAGSEETARPLQQDAAPVSSTGSARSFD